MSEKRQLTAQQLKDAYAAGERNFCEIEVLRESLSRGADLRGADLRDADLEGAKLEGADLRDADLEGAKLYGADLYGADLRGAKLYGAKLYGADLYGAKLYGADLRGAKHFLSARIPYMSSRGFGGLFTGTMYRDRLVVYAGCFKGEGCDDMGNGGSPDEFRAQVAETHGDNIHAQLYLAQLAVFEASWRHWLTTLPAEEATPEPQS